MLKCTCEIISISSASVSSFSPPPAARCFFDGSFSEVPVIVGIFPLLKLNGASPVRFLSLVAIASLKVDIFGQNVELGDAQLS